MIDLMFREYLGGDRWHYWGYLNGTFVAPMQTYDGKPLSSQQFTNLYDCDGGPIYDGDILCIGSQEANTGGAVVFADGRFTVVTETHRILILDKFLASICQVTGTLYERPDKI